MHWDLLFGKKIIRALEISQFSLLFETIIYKTKGWHSTKYHAVYTRNEKNSNMDFLQTFFFEVTWVFDRAPSDNVVFHFLSSINREDELIVVPLSRSLHWGYVKNSYLLKCGETYTHDLHIPVRCTNTGMEPGNQSSSVVSDESM